MIILFSLLVIGYQTFIFISLDDKKSAQTQIETQVAKEAGIERSLDVFVEASPDLPVNQYELLADNYISLKALIPLYGGYKGTASAKNEDKLIKQYNICLNYIVTLANDNNKTIKWAQERIENGQEPNNRCNDLNINSGADIPMIKFLNVDTNSNNTKQNLQTDINRQDQRDNDTNIKQIETIRRTFRQNYLEGSDKVMSTAMLRRQSDDRLQSKHHYLRSSSLTYDQARAILMDADIIHLDYDTFKYMFNLNQVAIVTFAKDIVEQVYIARERKSYNQDTTTQTNIIHAKLELIKEEFGL
jgi:hypothetical protein